MGTGDVLSGIIGGLSAINKDGFVSAVAGAYLHAMIGDILHKKFGDHITPMDLVERIPSALKEMGAN
jgi:NAD(P)H-hydrate epimerase